MQEIGAWAPVLIQLLGCAAPSLDDPIGVGYLCLSNVAKMNKGVNLNTDEVVTTEAPLSAPQDDMALHNAKDQFDHIPHWRFKRARAATNPWEKLGSGPFVNRSAMKLVNLDAALGLIDTAQRCVSAAAIASSNSSTLNAVIADATAALFSEEEEDDPGQGGVMASLSGSLNFVDLCGAPGGFSEYLLWRGSQRGEVTRGFGISLGCDNGEGDPCAWKIGDQRSKCVDGSDGGNLNTFEVCWGADGTGDLYSRPNIEHFVARVLAAIDTANEHGDGTSSSSNASSSSSSSSRGVALAVADGGFAAARDSHDQEALMSRLVAAECLCALGCLALGGTFVVKIFETRTEATLDMMTRLALSFHRVALIKPVTSRPASSERYLLCEGLLLRRGSAAMKNVVAHLWAMHAGVTPLPNDKAAPERTNEIKPETATSLDQASTSTPLETTAVAAVGGEAVHPIGGAFSDQMDYASARRHTATFLRAANARLGASQLAACEAILAHAHGLVHASKRKVSDPQASWFKSSSISLPPGFGSFTSQISDESHGEMPSLPSTHVQESDVARSSRLDHKQVARAQALMSTQPDFHGSPVEALESDQIEAATPLPDYQAKTRDRRSSRCLSYTWFRIQANHRTREHAQWETALPSTLNSADGVWADGQSAARYSDEQFKHQNIVAESTRVSNPAKKRKRARKNKKRAQQRASRDENGQSQLSDDEAEQNFEAQG